MKKFLFSLIAFGVSACTSMATPTALPTASPTPTSTPTPTVEWFPPTETPMPAPSQVFTPVPELSDLGEVIFRDDFDRPGNWRLEDTNRGCVNISNNEINLIIRESGTFLYSVLEEPKFTDFYVEITASPSLCAGKDEYGLMFRADENRSYYRYSLSCDGEIRMDRVIGGTAFSPQSWLPSSAVPSAAPSESRLGVWAKGNTLNFFIDGELQFSVTDDQIQQGSFGVFARSVGENAVTVSFTDLVVRELE